MEMINTATFTDSFNPGFCFQTDLVKGEACEVKGHQNGIEVSLYGIESNDRNTDQYNYDIKPTGQAPNKLKRNEETHKSIVSIDGDNDEKKKL